MLLALSGLALFHPSMFWLTALFGGGQWTRVLHPFVGVVMFLVSLFRRCVLTTAVRQDIH
ncbi:cytochrome b subunit of formate dehydrogenase [Paraburkholderia sp. 40]